MAVVTGVVWKDAEAVPKGNDTIDASGAEAHGRREKKMTTMPTRLRIDVISSHCQKVGDKMSSRPLCKREMKGCVCSVIFHGNMLLD
jgi:hypothetical protein